ncbi:response regulator [Gillisia marina]|uniref:response regulator n=1 Tax=Gillisia marina TaxID=1167637 RepID=UPI00029A01D3|nr:response regulator [Gillisia marina]
MIDQKVLIVDDDKIIRKIAAHMVKISKLTSSDPLLFENGLEAYNFLAIEKNKNKNFIIFLDINMPIMDGWTFLEKLEHEKLLDEKVIYLFTSSVDKEDHCKGLNNKNVKDIITKPMTIDKLRKINMSLQRVV